MEELKGQLLPRSSLVGHSGLPSPIYFHSWTFPDGGGRTPGDPEEKVPAQGTSQLLCVPRDVSSLLWGVWALRSRHGAVFPRSGRVGRGWTQACVPCGRWWWARKARAGRRRGAESPQWAGPHSGQTCLRFLRCPRTLSSGPTSLHRVHPVTATRLRLGRRTLTLDLTLRTHPCPGQGTKLL